MFDEASSFHFVESSDFKNSFRNNQILITMVIYQEFDRLYFCKKFTISSYALGNVYSAGKSKYP